MESVFEKPKPVFITPADYVFWWQVFGGSFNLELYLKICRIKQQQTK
jgi:hypothetical protein